MTPSRRPPHEQVRNSVVRLLQLSEERASEDADRAKGEQAYLRLVEGQPGWIAGWQLGEATRRRDDARLLRKSVEADLNRLELQLLQGDPSLAFVREVPRSIRDEEGLAHRHRQRSPDIHPNPGATQHSRRGGLAALAVAVAAGAV